MISRNEVEKLYRECVEKYSTGGGEAVWEFLELNGFNHKGMCLKCEGIRHVDPYDNSCMVCGQLATDMCIVELTLNEKKAIVFALKKIKQKNIISENELIILLNKFN
jgi:hypothetical protein